MDKLRKKIDEALRDNDVGRVRETVLEIIRRKSGQAGALDTIRYAIDKTPGLFEEETDLIELRPRERWSRDYGERLLEIAGRNFSRDKVGLLVEIFTDMSKNPGLYPRNGRPGEEVMHPDELASIREDMVVELDEREVEELAGGAEDALSASQEAADGLWDNGTGKAASRKKKVSAGAVLGYLLMALGAAAAIVALCVPVKFLLGLGIVVLMLGSIFVYYNIKN